MKLVFVLLAFAIALADSAKILAVFPVPAKSHYAIGEATMRALNEAGHEVTMISAFEPKKPMKNYRQITIENLIEAMAEGECVNCELVCSCDCCRDQGFDADDKNAKDRPAK